MEQETISPVANEVDPDVVGVTINGLPVGYVSAKKTPKIRNVRQHNSSEGVSTLFWNVNPDHDFSFFVKHQIPGQIAFWLQIFS